MNGKSYFCTLPSRNRDSYILLLLCILLTTSSSIFSQNCNRKTYRTIDGSCNNLSSPIANNYGVAPSIFQREIAAEYSSEDILNGIIFPNRPNPRAISNQLFDQNEDIGNSANLSSMVFTWAQFLDHDITQAKGARTETAPIQLPPDEPSFTLPIDFHRSAISTGTGIATPRNQDNLLTAWIDGSQVYGSDQDRADWLRTFVNGKLKISTGNLLPYNTVSGEKVAPIDANAPKMDNLDDNRAPHFVAGDVRAGEQPGLTVLHTLFVREHNRICEELIANGFQDDELIYQTARKQVGALIQAITYEQFLPALGVQLSPYIRYNSQVSPDIMNLFATAAYRIGHTMVTSELLLLNDDCSTIQSPLSLEQAFFNPSWVAQFNIDPILKGLVSQQQEEIDLKVIDGLRNFLFNIPGLPGAFGLDLVSLNIQRGRDHGLPDYKTVRQYFLNQNISTFTQINSDPIIAQQLASTFNNDVNNIDLWVGLLAEEHIPNSNMGPTMHEILKEQFERIRDGDYYYFQNDLALSLAEKQRIQNTQLSDIIKRNTSLNNLANDVFFTEICEPVLADCNVIEINALDGQIEIKGLNAPFSTVKVFDKIAGWAVVANCNGTECGSTQVFDLPTGDYFVQITFYEGVWQDFICQKEMNVSVSSSATFSCENVDITTIGNNLEINALNAPFSTIKIFDINNGWSVIESCIGEDCSANPVFNLPNGDYHLQLSAYQAPWQDLICAKSMDFSIGTTQVANCEDLIVTAQNGIIEVNGLAAPFCTVKVFDINNGWGVVADCAGDDCQENQLFTMPNGDYNVEVTMYQNVWQNEICQQYFPLNMEATAANRNKEALKVDVFPNPTTEVIHINLADYEGKAATLKLSNQFGQVMKHLDYSTLSKNILEIPIIGLPNGWYYLTMKVENRLPSTKKIMISRLY